LSERSTSTVAVRQSMAFPCEHSDVQSYLPVDTAIPARSSQEHGFEDQLEEQLAEQAEELDEPSLSSAEQQGRGRWKLVCAGLIAAAAIFVTVKGVRKASVSLRGAADVALWEVATNHCGGTFEVAGMGTVHLINAEGNTPGDAASNPWIEDSKINLASQARAYWGSACNPQGGYSQEDYLDVPLLNRRLQYTTDLSGAGCGCNTAFYLVSMTRGNTWETNCKDYYCDAMSVCGVRCLELDIQEANTRAFHSTFHDLRSEKDNFIGTGGGGAEWLGPRDWSANQYGVNGTCINTAKKFQVAIEFPVQEGTEQLKSIDVTLMQDGCSLRASKYDQALLQAFSDDLKKGMTPVLSDWNDAKMTWLDGNGMGEEAMSFCSKEDDLRRSCSKTVSFDDFSIAPLTEIVSM